MTDKEPSGGGASDGAAIVGATGATGSARLTPVASAPRSLHLGSYFAQLTGDGGCLPISVEPDFWDRQINALPPGRLISVLETGTAWPTWECHPNGEEWILQLKGSSLLQFDIEDTIQERLVRSGEFIIVPRGIWHTADASYPGRALFITAGNGTDIRAR